MPFSQAQARKMISLTEEMLLANPESEPLKHLLLQQHETLRMSKTVAEYSRRRTDSDTQKSKSLVSVGQGNMLHVVTQECNRTVDDSGAWCVNIVYYGPGDRASVHVSLTPAEKAAFKESLKAHVDPDLHRWIVVY